MDSIILYNYLRSLNKNIKIFINYVLGPLVFCLLVYSIYHQIQRQPDWKQSLEQIKRAFDSAALGKLLAVFGLMFVNWGIEARKWQVVIRHLQPISFFRSFKATFSGTTLAFFTPNRMGEYVGRVWFIDPGNRIKAVSLTIVSSMGQLLVTLVIGIVGLLYIRSIMAVNERDESVVFWINAVLYASLVAAIVLTLLYFRLAWLVKWIEKIPRIDKYVNHIRVLDNFNATILLRILSLSLARYLVFIAQYFLLFQVFDVRLSVQEVFWSISVVFLVLAIVPTIALLTELGVRWKVSLELVQLFSNNMVGILATSLTIWIINLVIPALIGSLLILNVKFFRNKENKLKKIEPRL
ncbi:MAG TPA: lysylphosphatidylglycerol synthase transmembrane domain-containing protein [Chitinophagaceae bacterium]|nr:lysylphosphatidylglycerol synthase transmembrane domain-containing protein [Chitinophagaceae bacterium]